MADGLTFPPPDLAPYVQTVQMPALVAELAPTAFVNGGAYQTVASLLSGYPAGPATVGMYGRVNDLWGSVRSVMVCEYDGSLYYWRPQRTDYATVNTATTGAMSLTPLLTSPQVIFTGTLLGNMTVTPSTTNAWPGAQFEVINNGVLGLFGINLAGLTGGTLPLVGGGRRILTAVNSGGGVLAWRGA